MLSRCAPREHRAFALGLAESTHGIAGVIGPVASGWLFENVSSSAPAIAAGVLCMLAAPVAMALPLSVIAASDLNDCTGTGGCKLKQQ
jgi:MFS family permease